MKVRLNMKILNKTFEKNMKDFVKENGLELNEYECQCYANLCEVLNQLVDNQFEFNFILGMYDYFTDVLDGKLPNIDIFSHKGAFKGFYRLSKRYSLTKNLTEEQRVHLCFAIYWASCIRTMNEKTMEDSWNLECFENGAEYIIKEYERMLEMDPGRFLIKTYSDATKGDYGFTPKNPIEVTSVSIQYQYLNGLETDKGEKITYDRIGSFEGEDGIYVDGYKIYVKGLLKKKKIATLYLTGDGSYNSLSTPKGFRFIK